jgi:bifunctional non-homologous end joining protein LigD
MPKTSEYDRKRSFDRTPEPPSAFEGDVDPALARPGNHFVIQQHYATRLHHDVRLEMLNGDVPVLVSWAVPKGLPLRSGVRTLAIHVEDHPWEYRTFSGSIPKGEYGGGEVRIFDQGSYEMLDREPGKLTFRLEGSRLRGIWHFIRTGTESGKEQWLAILSEDQRPNPAPLPPPDPMLATLGDDAFDDPAWSFEPKWDGIRAIAICTDETRLVSRNRHDVTVAYPELAGLHDRLVATDAVLDGEIIALEQGVPSFQALQHRMHLRRPADVERAARSHPVTFMAFDLLYLDGEDVTSHPLNERQGLLEETVVPSASLQVSPVVIRTGHALFTAARAQGLEGVMAKRIDSRYHPGRRSPDWVKIKTVLDADVVILGWRPGSGNRSGTIGSLVLGVYDGDRLRYVGNVGTGFDRDSLAAVLAELEVRERAEPVLGAAERKAIPQVRQIRWVEPELVATVDYRQLTEAGRLRAPSFKGLRDDKDPRQCRFEDLATVGPSGS